MPPKRCPECGRFLSNELVASLADASVPCPRCETPLEVDKLIGGAGSSRRAQRRQAAEVRAATATAVGAGRDDADGGGDNDSGGDGDGDGDDGVDAPLLLQDDAPIDGGAAPSVRPPDLDPSEVRAPGDGVLAGWDIGVTADEVDSWRADRRPFPTDAVVVAGAALLGGVLGAAVTDRHRALGTAVGVLSGGVAAGAARRVWELEG